ncbi:hypothetical protein [Arthrobacter sp. YD2]|uniref:hypothetical protein n=1 Tax=Arthrobacter sp. YD2 TaxID=3058046 RepID=UPI0025B355E2|nr:hypothetical protein [Arthrobacter sp. YD2]MDN3905499.1 hypothetical protein [Arthrobacter sp. YD2]
MGLFSSDPIVAKKEHWASPQPPHVVLHALTQAFSSHGERLRHVGPRLEVRLGSLRKFRNWGHIFAEGRANMPLALIFSTAPSGYGTAITVHAFDEYGFRLADGSLFGVPEAFDRRLEEFLTYAAGVVGVHRPGPAARPAPGPVPGAESLPRQEPRGFQ